jgi:hypothetical protein
MYAARQAKSPLLEKLAIGTMLASAVSTTAIGVIHLAHMNHKDHETQDQLVEKTVKRVLAELNARERAPSRGLAR